MESSAVEKFLVGASRNAISLFLICNRRDPRSNRDRLSSAIFIYGRRRTTTLDYEPISRPTTDRPARAGTGRVQVRAQSSTVSKVVDFRRLVGKIQPVALEPSLETDISTSLISFLSQLRPELRIDSSERVNTVDLTQIIPAIAVALVGFGRRRPDLNQPRSTRPTTPMSSEQWSRSRSPSSGLPGLASSRLQGVVEELALRNPPRPGFVRDTHWRPDDAEGYPSIAGQNPQARVGRLVIDSYPLVRIQKGVVRTVRTTFKPSSCHPKTDPSLIQACGCQGGTQNQA